MKSMMAASVLSLLVLVHFGLNGRTKSKAAAQLINVTGRTNVHTFPTDRSRVP